MNQPAKTPSSSTIPIIANDDFRLRLVHHSEAKTPALSLD
jgi:hypothetical protein